MSTPIEDQQQQAVTDADAVVAATVAVVAQANRFYQMNQQQQSEEIESSSVKTSHPSTSQSRTNIGSIASTDSTSAITASSSQFKEKLSQDEELESLNEEDNSNVGGKASYFKRSNKNYDMDDYDDYDDDDDDDNDEMQGEEEREHVIENWSNDTEYTAAAPVTEASSVVATSNNETSAEVANAQLSLITSNPVDDMPETSSSFRLPKAVNSHLSINNSETGVLDPIPAVTSIKMSKISSNSPQDFLPFEAKSKHFEMIFKKTKSSLSNQKSSKPLINTSMLLKLADLYDSNESYFTIMLAPLNDMLESKNNENLPNANLDASFKRMRYISFTNQSSDDEENDDDDDENWSFSSKKSSSIENMLDNTDNNEFHLCKLCMHCLCEPVTLVCGCSYCKNCLKEYNLNILKLTSKKDQHQSVLISTTTSEASSVDSDQIKKRKHEVATRNEMHKCVNCEKVHKHNTFDHLKPNVILSNLTERFWVHNIEIRRLRNDIRNYVRYSIENSNVSFDFDLFEMMFLEAYNLDESNHLIIADLFFLNFYNQKDLSLSYAETACLLKPNWPFAYFMKAIYYQSIDQIAQVIENLTICLKLNSSLNAIRASLDYLSSRINNSKLTSSSSNQNISLKRSNPLMELFSNLNNSNQINGPIDDRKKHVYIDPSLAKYTDLECSLCYRLLFKPVTTPCGHSFCRSCLDRSLDHQDKCPLCKNSLTELFKYLAERRQNVTLFIDKLIKIYYAIEHNDRVKQDTEELKEILSSDNEIPVFVCTLALPYAPCPLHIYEPRYRLMIRRAIETGKNEFGMCMYSERTPYHHNEYGCMLEIKSYQFTRDGRAVVATVGGRRFKVLNSSTKDGYNVSRVEWINDKREETEAEQIELQTLHDDVYNIALAWYACLPEIKKSKINDIYGIRELPAPEIDIQSANGPYWHWFLLSILPLEHDFQYKFITKTSLRERLKQLKKILIILMPAFERLRQLNETSSNQSSTQTASNSSQVASSTSSRTESSTGNLNASPSRTDSSLNQILTSNQEPQTESDENQNHQNRQQQQQ